MDSSGRALVFQYRPAVAVQPQSIASTYRIVRLTGYDNDPTSGSNDLLGLEVDYGYDQYGNLTSVTKLQVQPGGGILHSDVEHQEYTYTDGNGPLGHNMTSYTDPDGFQVIAALVPGQISDNDFQKDPSHTTTYVYYPGPGQPGGGTTCPSRGSTPAPASSTIRFRRRVQRVRQGGHPGDGSHRFQPAGNHRFLLLLQLRSESRHQQYHADDAQHPRGHRPASRRRATTYTLDIYGATTKIDEPNLSDPTHPKVTTMVWAMDQPDAQAVPSHGGRDVEMLSQTDALGRTTSYRYDCAGQRHPGNDRYQHHHGPDHPASAGRRRNGHGRHRRVEPPSQIITRYTYDPLFSKMTSQTDADGNTTFYILDSPIPLSDDTGLIPQFPRGLSRRALRAALPATCWPLSTPAVRWLRTRTTASATC